MAIQAKHTGVLSAAGYAVTMNVDGLAGIGLQLTGTWVGTLDFKGSVDGVEFQSITVVPTNSTTGVTSATANGVWQVSAALKLVQVSCSAYTSGYIVVSILAGESSVGGAGGGGGGGGAVTQSGVWYFTPVAAASATLSNVASSATNVTLLASNASRRNAIIVNDSTSVLYVKFGATASATSYTYRLPAYNTLELPVPVYQGIIDGIWVSANGNARVTEEA